MRRLVLAVLPLALLSACQPATTELTEEQKAEIAAEVDSVASDWWSAWSVVDFDRGMSFYADAPETAWAGDGEVHYSIANIDSHYRPFFAGLQRQDVNVTGSRTIVLAPDIVYTIRSTAIVAVDTAGAPAPETRFVETIVWVKRNNQWKVLLGHGSTPSESM